MEKLKVINQSRRYIPEIYVDAINKIINKNLKNIDLTKEFKIYIPKNILTNKKPINSNVIICSNPKDADYIFLNLIEKEGYKYMYKTSTAYLSGKYYFVSNYADFKNSTLYYKVLGCLVPKNKYPWLKDFETFERKKIYNFKTILHLFKEPITKTELKSICEYLRSNDIETKTLGLKLLSTKNLYEHFYDIIMILRDMFIKSNYTLNMFNKHKDILEMFNLFYINECCIESLDSFYKTINKISTYITKEDKKKFANYFSKFFYKKFYDNLDILFNTDDLNYQIEITLLDNSFILEKNKKNFDDYNSPTLSYKPTLHHFLVLYKFLNDEGKKIVLEKYKEALQNTAKYISNNTVKIKILWEK